MVTLYQFKSVNGLNSPFCMKVETYCKLAKIPYQVVNVLAHKGPRGKLPFIEDQGKIIADSGLVLTYLKEAYGDPLDEKLSEEQRALGHLMTRLCEESLYFVIVYSRWSDAAFWQHTNDLFFSGLSPVIRRIIPAMIRRNNRKMLYFQGYGRFSREEIYQMGADDICAIAVFLKNTRYAVADHPTSFDAVLYGFLANIVRIDAETPLKAVAMQYPVLPDYLQSMDAILNA